MESLKKWSKPLFVVFAVLYTTQHFVYLLKATEISDRYAIIRTFQDDHDVGPINDNFRRITQAFTSDGGFNLIINGTSTIVQLNRAQTDTSYGVFIMTSFSTATTVIDKTTTNFKVQTSSPNSASGGTLDWTLVR